MKQLRTLLCLILLAAMTSTASHAADPVRVAPVGYQTGVVVLPQVVIVGKRLDPIEKNRLAQTRQQAHTVQQTATTNHKS